MNQTHLAIGNQYRLEARLVSLERRAIATDVAEDVLHDELGVSAGLDRLFLFIPLDDIARSEDVGVVEQLQRRLDLDEAGGGQRVRVEGGYVVGVRVGGACGSELT